MKLNTRYLKGEIISVRKKIRLEGRQGETSSMLIEYAKAVYENFVVKETALHYIIIEVKS